MSDYIEEQRQRYKAEAVRLCVALGYPEDEPWRAQGVLRGMTWCGPEPEVVTYDHALAAVLIALTSEGVNAWNGDGTSIVAQMIVRQSERLVEARHRIAELEGLIAGRKLGEQTSNHLNKETDR